MVIAHWTAYSASAQLKQGSYPQLRTREKKAYSKLATSLKDLSDVYMFHMQITIPMHIKARSPLPAP